MCVYNETCVRVVDPKSLLKLHGCIYQRMLLLLYNTYYTQLYIYAYYIVVGFVAVFDPIFCYTSHFYVRTCCTIIYM